MQAWLRRTDALILTRWKQEGVAVPDEMSDPKGLVRESYLIDGITASECRSIFLDWAMSLPEGVAPKQALRDLIAVYGEQADHPMTQILHEGLRVEVEPARRGGRSARIPSRPHRSGAT